MAYQNKQELSFTYAIFRPMLKDLLKLNIDFSQNKASDQEIDVFIKWMNENMTDIVSDEDLFNFRRSIMYEKFTVSENSGYNNSIEIVNGRDLSDDLKKFKKEEEINIVWTIKASFATLENFPEMPCGKIRNYDKKFEELLDKLHFSKEAKKIYSYNNSPYFRFNALKDPDNFVNSILCVTNFSRDGNINIIRTYYAKDDWLAKYEDFKNLLDLWKKKDKDPKDYNIYYKTINILTKLIPVITEDGILLTTEQYNEAKLLIQEEMLNYCIKNEYVIKSPILQGLKEYTQFKEAMEHLLSLMKDKNLNYDYKGALMLNYGYKEELMLYYAELLNSFIVLIKDKHEKIECILNKRKLDSVFNHNPDDLSMKNSSENLQIFFLKYASITLSSTMHFLQRHYIIQLYQITKYDESEENKMEKKGCAIFESQLISAFESGPFTLALLSNTLAVIKPDLMKNGFRDFPVLTLTGKPGSGKTTIAPACTPSHIKEYSFTDKVSAVKKELLNITDTYVLLDDFAAFVSHAAREKAYTFLDEVARLSYSGNMPLLIITAEEQALARITGSCKERLLELQVNDVLNDKDLKNILDYLMNKKYLLDKIFSEFAQWYEKNKENYNYKNLLRVFREKNTGKNPRSISLFFAYYTSMIIFCDFAENIYHVTVSKNKIEKTYMKSWEKRTTSTLSREALVQKLFQSLITDQAFSPIKPKEKQICEAICYGKCYYSKEFPVDGCSANCSEIMKGFYYDPRDLILQTESSSVILIENAEYLYGYPKYCNTNTPFMIIRDDVLLSFINSELHKLCSENKVHLQPFGAKELHKTLFALNMCMYHYISNKHKTYTFQYHSLSESNVSIMVICLTDYQFKKLAKSARRPIPFHYSQRKMADFCSHLTNMYKTIHGMLGEIGV